MKPVLDCIALGHQIKSRRKAKYLNQRSLARMADVSLSFLGHIERGTRKASLETLMKISIALETTPNDLLRDSLDATNTVDDVPLSDDYILGQIRQLLDKYTPDK